MPEGGGLVVGWGKDGSGQIQVNKGVSEGFCCYDFLVCGERGGHGNLGGELVEGIGVVLSTGLVDPHPISAVVFTCRYNIPDGHGVQCP